MAWINKIEINSESSDRIYVVSQHETERYWACSCPAGKTQRKCKHLKNLGFPCGKKGEVDHLRPFEIGDDMKNNDFLSGYKTNTDGRQGNPTQWREALAAKLGKSAGKRAASNSAPVRQVASGGRRISLVDEIS